MKTETFLAARRRGWVLCLSAAVMLGAAAFGSCRGKPRPPEPGAGPTVIIRNQHGEDWIISVELARTESEKIKGLMWRWSLPKDHGMLFIYDAPQVHTFWMKNTRIPLDMIFIGSDLRIAGIVENAEPYTETPRRVELPSQYVLEVNGGESTAHRLAAGNQVFLFGIESK